MHGHSLVLVSRGNMPFEFHVPPHSM